MGRQATPAGIELANIALTDLRITRKILQARLNLDRQPIDNFFKGKSVSDETFVGICEILKLDWKTIAGVVGPQTPNSGGFETGAVGSAPPELGAGGPPGIDAIVQQVRSAIEPLIREQCGTMRVLDMDQPIELTGDRGIYTNVNILEKQSRLRSERELLEDCDFDNRMVRERRIPGLKAVEKHRRLMVLGKPGAGKTTFLKYLAMQCITGGFAADKVPFFVTLKDFAETDDRPSLVDYLSRSIGGGAKHSGEESSASPTNHLPNASPLLLAGRSLILLDGLDEVREEDTARVIREMRDTADRLWENQFVITCRIAAKEYTFERFTEVEVADFGEQQIATFAENWFRAKNDLPKAETFVQRLKENEPIYELARSPLLLTLLCLVFGDGADFPTNRADLYEEGVKILLKKWDAKRNIQRDELYKKLDVQRREDLLSYVALQTFQQKEYFIKQRRLEGYIADFIGNLRDVDPEPEALRIDSAVVLKSIQSQHGLLVERARGIYSFSHLTFQEYFTAREIAATNQVDFLVARIREKRWREVFLLTVGMMRNADELILATKLYIDLRLVQDKKIQQFLEWVNQKSSSVQVSYKLAAVRAFYLNLDFDRDPDCRADRNQKLHLHWSLDQSLYINRGLDMSDDFYIDIDLYHALDQGLYQDPDQKYRLQDIQHQLPRDAYKVLKKIWPTNGQQSREDLRQIMITHRNIGHDWQFTDDQKALLQQYYDANRLLVECLNSDCYVSRSVREEIEATLLLPMGEIEKLRMQN
jgi:predicted NACHT family NTPase